MSLLRTNGTKAAPPKKIYDAVVLDHAAVGRNRLNADNVIDSKSLEHALCEKPVPFFAPLSGVPRADRFNFGEGAENRIWPAL